MVQIKFIKTYYNTFWRYIIAIIHLQSDIVFSVSALTIRKIILINMQLVLHTQDDSISPFWRHKTRCKWTIVFNTFFVHLNSFCAQYGKTDGQPKFYVIPIPTHDRPTSDVKQILAPRRMVEFSQINTASLRSLALCRTIIERGQRMSITENIISKTMIIHPSRLKPIQMIIIFNSLYYYCPLPLRDSRHRIASQWFVGTQSLRFSWIGNVNASLSLTSSSSSFFFSQFSINSFQTVECWLLWLWFSGFHHCRRIV